MFNIAQGEKQLLSLINATVSHELKNPLNSICAENIQKENLLNELRDLLNNKNISAKDLIERAL